jgi:hypothetical protein
LLRAAATQRGITTSENARGAVSSSLPKLPSSIRVSISGQTLVNQEQTQVLLRGTGEGNVPVDVAIQLQVISETFTGQIQLRSADHMPLCSGDISGTELSDLQATCKGYGQELQLQLSFDTIQRFGFSGSISGNLRKSS